MTMHRSQKVYSYSSSTFKSNKQSAGLHIEVQMKRVKNIQIPAVQEGIKLIHPNFVLLLEFSVVVWKSSLSAVFASSNLSVRRRRAFELELLSPTRTKVSWIHWQDMKLFVKILSMSTNLASAAEQSQFCVQLSSLSSIGKVFGCSVNWAESISCSSSE